jgi:hypothetical protein
MNLKTASHVRLSRSNRDNIQLYVPVPGGSAEPEVQQRLCGGKVDTRLPGKGNSNSHAARPVY